MRKVLITGDRNWVAPVNKDPEFGSKQTEWLSRRMTVREAIQRLELDLKTVNLAEIMIIHGAAKGVDTLVANTAHELGCMVKAYPALWNVYGNGAGPIRNREMLDKNPDIELCLAFHDDLIGKSKGTLHMCRYAKMNGVPVTVYRSDGSSYPFIYPTTTRRFGNY